MQTHILRTVGTRLTLLGLISGLAGCVVAPPIVEQAWPNGYDSYLVDGTTAPEDSYRDDSPRVSTHLYFGYGPMFLYDSPFYYASPWYYTSPWYYPTYRHRRMNRPQYRPDRDAHRWGDRPKNPTDRRDRDHRNHDRNAHRSPDQRPRDPNPNRRPTPHNNGGNREQRPTPTERPQGHDRAYRSNDTPQSRRGYRPSPSNTDKPTGRRIYNDNAQRQ